VSTQNGSRTWISDPKLWSTGMSRKHSGNNRYRKELLQ
jgi:hypothetical protein